MSSISAILTTRTSFQTIHIAGKKMILILPMSYPRFSGFYNAQSLVVCAVFRLPLFLPLHCLFGGCRRGCDRTTTCAISTYHHYSCEFEPRSWRGVLDTTVCDKVCQWFTTGRWDSAGTPDSSTNKTDRHDMTEILLKVALNTIYQTKI